MKRYSIPVYVDVYAEDVLAALDNVQSRMNNTSMRWLIDEDGVEEISGDIP